jgi:hypothetical protein
LIPAFILPALEDPSVLKDLVDLLGGKALGVCGCLEGVELLDDLGGLGGVVARFEPLEASKDLLGAILNGRGGLFLLELDPAIARGGLGPNSLDLEGLSQKLPGCFKPGGSRGRIDARGKP